MALTIVNEQYPPRKPKLTLTADSLDELPTEGVAEGSTATVGGTEYSYDSNAGWIVPGEGGGGSGGGVLDVNITTTDWAHGTADKTFEEMAAAINTGYVINAKIVGEDIFIPLMIESFSSSSITLNSITFLVSDNLLEMYEVAIGESNAINISYHTYTLTPAT